MKYFLFVVESKLYKQFFELDNQINERGSIASRSSMER